MFQYAVQPGDTIYSIADKFNVSVDAILSANPGLYPSNLVIGQIIRIPTGYYPRYPSYPSYPIFPIFPIPFRRFGGNRPFPGGHGGPGRPGGGPGEPGGPGRPGGGPGGPGGPGRPGRPGPRR